MALVSVGFELVVQLRDNGGQSTLRTYELRAEDFDEAETATPVILTALAAVTNCVVAGYRLAEVFAEDALVLPAAGVQNQDNALISGKIEGDPLESWTIFIPGPKIGIFTATSGPGADVVDASDAAVIAYVSLFSPAGQAFISDGESAETTGFSGRRMHKGSRRG